jgi:hypothetical protein
MTEKSLNIDEWFSKLRSAMVENPDATSVMVGAPERNGELDFTRSALVFGVPKKGQIETREIPKTWRGMETDVQTHNPGNKREATTDGIDPARADTTAKHDRLSPGMSIGPLDQRGSGTLGMIVWDDETSEPRILTNDHVIPGPRGTELTQPGFGDATLVNVVGAKLRGTQSVFDYAVVSIYPGLAYSNVPLGHLDPITGTAAAEVGQVVHKMGRTTKRTTGRIVAIGVVKMVKPDRIDYLWAAKIKPLDELNIADAEISKPGDSGSVWFDDEMRAVALHFAGEVQSGGEYEFAEACPVVDVLRHAKCHVEDPRGDAGINAAAIRYKLDRVHEMVQTIENATSVIKSTADGIEDALNR